MIISRQINKPHTMLKHIVTTILATYTLLFLPLFGQTVLDTLTWGIDRFEVLQFERNTLQINYEKDSYLDLLRHAKEKERLQVCPLDSELLNQIATTVRFDEEKNKFNVFIATTPYPANDCCGGDNMMVYIPTVTQRSDGGADLEYFFDPVGYFGPSRDFGDDPFPALGITMVEYELNWEWNRERRNEPNRFYYDWVFLRKIQEGF